MFSSDVRLSERQAQVLRYMAEGFTNVEMAGKMYLSPATTKLYRLQLLEALGARNAAHAVSLGHQLGLLRH